MCCRHIILSHPSSTSNLHDIPPCVVFTLIIILRHQTVLTILNILRGCQVRQMDECSPLRTRNPKYKKHQNKKWIKEKLQTEIKKFVVEGLRSSCTYVRRCTYVTARFHFFHRSSQFIQTSKYSSTVTKSTFFLLLNLQFISCAVVISFYLIPPLHRISMISLLVLCLH